MKKRRPNLVSNYLIFVNYETFTGLKDACNVIRYGLVMIIYQILVNNR